MNKENLLFVVIGFLCGAVTGFIFANSINQRDTMMTPGTTAKNSALPADHLSGQNMTGGSLPEVVAAIELAKKEPDNFEAQLKAGELYYQIQRFDGAIEFLDRANKLRPENREVMVHLGNALFDVGKYADAANWYLSALEKNANDVNVRMDLGLTFILREPPDYDRAIKEFRDALELDPKHPQTLQNLTVAYTKKGDAAEAGKILAMLEALDPAGTSVPLLREEIKKLEAK